MHTVTFNLGLLFSWADIISRELWAWQSTKSFLEQIMTSSQGREDLKFKES